MERRDAGFEKRREAREKYKPNKIKRLLILEAPPEDLDRYFYFEISSVYDDLFKEVIHAIYRYEFPEISVKCRTGNRLEDRKPNTTELRQRKAEFLCLFKKDGFHLIDAVDCPIPQAVSSERSTKIVSANFPNLAERMTALATKDTQVILIKSSVCALKDQLINHNFKVINECMIPFPNNHHQKEFRREMQKLLRSYFEERNGKKKRQVRSLVPC